MGVALDLPRLVFGAGALADLPGELALLGVERPLLISDRGLAAAGLVDAVQAAAPTLATIFPDVPENPTAAGADSAAQAFRTGRCDGVVALGGGSVLDTAKIVAALVESPLAAARDLIGRPDRIAQVAPLVAIPTTLGTGSESSPVAALHLEPGGPGIGTRHRRLVPRTALCDPNVTRTLPRRLIAATAIDALSHCLEGFFAEPANPLVDAMALDGAARVFADVQAALEPQGDAARASLMAAAFAGGAAIHKGLGPAHAVALACGDQDIHHGTLIAVALPPAVELVARHAPGKAARLRAALGLANHASLAATIRSLADNLGLPRTLAAAGYRIGDRQALAREMSASHFNRTSPYPPTPQDYARLLAEIAG